MLRGNRGAAAVNAVLAYELARQSWMASVERLVTLGWGLDGVLRAGVPGAVVELGCNAGHTSVWLASCLAAVPDARGETRELVLFDSFAGLPVPGPQDTATPTVTGRADTVADLTGGDLPATRRQVLERFAHYGLPTPRIVPGWFADTLGELPDRIAAAYLDADLYDSTLTGLRAVWPRLSPGGLLVVDDYCDPTRDPHAWAGLPGVKRACDEFFTPLGLTVAVVPGIADYRATGYLYKQKDLPS